MTSSTAPPLSHEPDNYDEFSMHQDLLFSDSLKVGVVPYLYHTSCMSHQVTLSGQI